MTHHATPADATHRGAVVIYGPQGCGKTRCARELASYFGKLAIVDPWLPGTPLPADCLALTAVDGIPGAIPFNVAVTLAVG